MSCILHYSFNIPIAGHKNRKDTNDTQRTFTRQKTAKNKTLREEEEESEKRTANQEEQLSVINTQHSK